MRAERTIDGILVNPVLPRRFYGTDNARRPNSPWWGVPYVTICPSPVEEKSGQLALWLEDWPSGNRFDTYCLDGGAWDRPTVWGRFRSLEEAIACAKEGPAWRGGVEDTPGAFLEGLKGASAWQEDGRR